MGLFGTCPSLPRANAYAEWNAESIERAKNACRRDEWAGGIEGEGMEGWRVACPQYLICSPP